MNQNLFTNLEDSRRVAPIMERLGIEADGYVRLSEPFEITTDNNALICDYPVWRLGELLLALGLLGHDGFYKGGAEELHEACERLIELDKGGDFASD